MFQIQDETREAVGIGINFRENVREFSMTVVCTSQNLQPIKMAIFFP